MKSIIYSQQKKADIKEIQYIYIIAMNKLFNNNYCFI